MDTNYNVKLILEAQDKASKQLESISDSLKGLGDTAQKSQSKMSSFAENNKKSFDNMKTYGTLAFGAIVFAMNTFVNKASEARNALVGLESIARGTGKDFDKSKQFLDSFTSDGLVPMTEAATGLKNLFARGFSLEESIQLLNRFKDSASFGRQASYSLGEAVMSATEGLKNENSILVDNAGVTKNVAKMREEYAKKIGVTTNNLTIEQKREAEYQGILEETKFQVGDAIKITNEYAGAKARLGKSFSDLQVQLGNAFMPILQSVIQTIQPAIEAVTRFASENPKLTSTITLLALGLAGLVAVLGVLLPLLPAIGGAIAVLTGPIGLVIAGVVALGVAFATNFLGIRDVTVSLMTQVGDFLSSTMTDISNERNAMLESMGLTNKDVWEGIKTTVTVVMAVLKVAIQVGFELIKGVVTSAISFISTYIQRTFSGIRDVIDGITKVIGSIMKGNFKEAISGVAQVFGGVYKILTAPFVAAKNMIVAVIDGMIGGINKLIDSLNEVGKAVGIQLPNIKKLGEETAKASKGREHDIEGEKKAVAGLVQSYKNAKDIITKTQKQASATSKDTVKAIGNSPIAPTKTNGGGGGGGGASSALKEANDLAKEQADLAYKTQESQKKAFDTIKEAGQKAYNAIIDRVGKSKEKMADFEMKIIDVTKKFKDMQDSMTKDMLSIDYSIRGISEQTMKDLSVRSIEVTKSISDMQKQLAKEEDSDKKKEIQDQIVKLQAEQNFLMGNTTEEARKQAEEYAKMSESQKMVFNQQQQINDLVEKQNIMKAFQGGSLGSSGITMEGQGQQLKAFYKDQVGNLKEVTDLKNIQYAQELMDKQTAIQTEISQLQSQKDAEKLILEQAEKDKALFEDMWLQKLSLSTDAQVAMLARVEQKYYDVAQARAMAEGGQSVAVPPSAPKQASGQTFNFSVDGTQFNMGSNKDFNSGWKKLGGQFMNEATRKQELYKEYGVK